jgi:hypothetical protein
MSSSWRLRSAVATQTRTFKEEINVSPGRTLDLRLQIGRSVRIFRSDGASVSVEGIFSGGDTADIIVAARPTPRGVEISSEYAARRGHRPLTKATAVSMMSFDCPIRHFS